MRTILIAVLLLAPLAATAQQGESDSAFLAKALTSIQHQRNQALDMLAGAEAREAILKAEVAKLKARVDELEKMAPAK